MAQRKKTSQQLPCAKGLFCKELHKPTEFFVNICQEPEDGVESKRK
jgi:hypothetical protein